MQEQLRIGRLGFRWGPSLEADWPCVTFTVATTVTSLDDAAPAKLVNCIAAALERTPETTTREWEPLTIATLFGQLVLALQGAVGPTIERFNVTPTSSGCTLAIGCLDARIGGPAVHVALRWMNGGLNDGKPSGKIANLADFVRSFAATRIPLENRLLIEEATRREIPWMRITDLHFQIGQGHKRRRLRRGFTDKTSFLSVEMATLKPVAAQLMAAAGLPVPQHVVTEDQDAAVHAAREIGFPVVLKPSRADQGIGVHLNVFDEAAVKRLFPAVRRHGKVLVEKQEPGFDHRMLVLNGKLIAAARRLPAQIVGDGQSTIRELIDAANMDPRRGVNHSNVLEKITIDDELRRTLTSAGLNLQSVPEAKRVVSLRLTANIATGAIAEDVTDLVHPENRKMAECAAGVLGLDLAGVDFISTDISRSHLEIGGAICEINQGPGFRPHLAAPGSPDVVRLMVEAFFPHPDIGRIPIAAITGTNGKTTTSRMVAAILRDAGHTVGLATTDGVEVDGTRVASGDHAGPKGATAVLVDRSVTAAVLETARGGIIKYGMDVDACSVGAVLNVGSDHIGTDGISTIDELARVKGRVLHAARDVAVLNADDPQCLSLVDSVRAKDLFLVGRDARCPAISDHLERGGVAVILKPVRDDQAIVLRAGADELMAIGAKQIPASHGGAAEFNIQNAMFAAAIGFGLGVSASSIENALKQFHPDTIMSSGRANLIGGWPFEILVDYAHNEEAILALSNFASRLPVKGRRLVTLAGIGNRADDSYARLAAAAAPWFDYFVCTTETPRGRAEGEVGGLLAEGLETAGVAPDRIEVVEPFESAVNRVLTMAQPGDLAVLIPWDPRRTINRLLKKGGSDSASTC